MPINLTKVYGRLNNVKRKLFYGTTTPSLKLLNVNDVLIELTENWYMPPTVTSNRAIGGEYWELVISDTTDTLDLDRFLTMTTQVEVAGERYRILQYTRPRGLTKQWLFRLESTGERVNG